MPQFICNHALMKRNVTSPIFEIPKGTHRDTGDDAALMASIFPLARNRGAD